MAASERDMYSALPSAFIADWDSTVNTRYGHQEEGGESKGSGINY
jgi:hypothetical protein